MMLLTTLALAVLLAAAILPAHAAEYFLSPEGDDNGAGTREAPWRTIAKANESVQPGDTVTLLDGQYPGVIEPAVSGAEGAPVTYRAETPLGAVLTGGQSSAGARVCVLLQDREHIIIEGFEMLPERGGWMLLERASHCIIRDGRMENATGMWAPILARDCHYNRYQRLQVWRSNQIGERGHVSCNMWDNRGSTHNVFEDVHFSRAAHCPFMLWLDAPNNVVRRCTFDGRWGRNFEFFATPRLLMEQCVITNGFNGSGSADGRAKLFVLDSIFRRNVIHRNHYGPLVINSYKYGDMDAFAMLRSRLYHNTWYRNHHYGFEMIDLGREPEQHFVADNAFLNNIFAFNDPGGDGLALLLYSNIAPDNRFFHNILYGDRPGAKTVRHDWTFPGIGGWGGLRMTASEANETMPGQFRGNTDADPLFADAETDDFRLHEGSPAIDAGAPLAVALQTGTGRVMAVDDARWFYDGFGIPGEVGDLIFIGPDRRQARIVSTDIEADLLTLDRDVSWREGDGISLPHLGAAPDLGAYERGAEGEPWHAAPRIPPGTRLLTMQTATEPVVVTDFEEDTLEDWHYYWNFSRQPNTDARIVDTTAASGRRSVRVFATGDEATLSCDIRPRWWDIDRFPTVRMWYRIPPGVPVGLWLYAFPSAAVGRGAVCIGGTETRKTDAFPDLARHELVDDDTWREIVIDARIIREVFPDVKLLERFRFETRRNGREGQEFWFDDFIILPDDFEG